MVEQELEIQNADIYRKLQENLDKLPIGFPATKSGSDLKVLTHFFTAEEAKIASHLKWELQSVDQIYETSKDLKLNQQELESKLETMAKKGSIRFFEKNIITERANLETLQNLKEFFQEKSKT